MNKIMQGIDAASLGTVKIDNTGALEGYYCFADSFAGFNGHFPGHPILPAIVEIMIVVALVGEKMECRQRLVAVEDAKFLKPVLPWQKILVRCLPRTIKGRLLYAAQLMVEDTTTATLLLDLACAGEQP